MSRKHFYYILATMLCSIALSACGDDEPNSKVPADACYDFVTLAESGPNGSTFTLQKSEDSPLISYTTPISFSPDSAIQSTTRLIIQYKRTEEQAPYTSGPIDLYGYRLLDNTRQRIVQDTLEAVQSMPVKMQSITRTGQFINMQLQLSCTRAEKPKILVLAADTLASIPTDGIAKLRLFYSSPSPGENYFTGYASFNIERYWLSPLWKGIEISYETPKGTMTAIWNKND